MQCPWLGSLGGGGIRKGEGWQADWRAQLGESQMTVAGAIQCRYPTEFDLEKKSTFLLRKKVPFNKKKKKKSVLIFFSSFFLLRAPLSFIYLFQIATLFHSLLFSPSCFTRSRLARHPPQTPDLLRQYPQGQCPQWADERSSAICTRSLSCPSVPCVSCSRPPSRCK